MLGHVSKLYLESAAASGCPHTEWLSLGEFADQHIKFTKACVEGLLSTGAADVSLLDDMLWQLEAEVNKNLDLTLESWLATQCTQGKKHFLRHIDRDSCQKSK